MTGKLSLTDWLSLLLCSIFLFLYVTLSAHSRPGADDFYFLKNLETYGWWQSMVVSWHSWVTRWASVLWLNTALLSWKLTGSFLLFQFLTLAVLLAALNKMASQFQNILMMTASNWRVSILLLVTFFFLMPSTGQTFFWITSACMYLWGLMAACFGFLALASQRKTIATYLLVAFCFTYTGGAAEAISIPALIFLAVHILYNLRRNKKSAPLPYFAFLFLLCSIFITYSGEGRALRQSALPDTAIVHALLITLKSTGKMLLQLLSGKIIMTLLLFLTWMGLGMTSGVKRLSLKSIFTSFLFAIPVVILMVLPAAFLLGDMPPDRAWIFVSLLLTLLLAFTGIVSATFLPVRKKKSYLLPVSLVLMIVMVSSLSLEQWQISTVYARAYDERIFFLQKSAADETKEIVLEKLPPAGMLFSSEITTDTSDFRNRHLQKYIGLKVPVRINE